MTRRRRPRISVGEWLLMGVFVVLLGTFAYLSLVARHFAVPGMR